MFQEFNGGWRIEFKLFEKIKYRDIQVAFFFLLINVEGKHGVEKFRTFGSILTLLIIGKVLISLKATFIPPNP